MLHRTFLFILLVVAGVVPSAMGRAEQAPPPKVGFVASSQLLTGQTEATYYDTESRTPIEVVIPKALGDNGWFCALLPRKVSGRQHSQNIFCSNKKVHSVLQVGAECESSTIGPVFATASLRSLEAPDMGTTFTVGCQVREDR